jgi:hypothetical protein
MAMVAPYHTDSPAYALKDRSIYHDKDTCPNGRRIELGHRKDGKGGKKHCFECNKVN